MIPVKKRYAIKHVIVFTIFALVAGNCNNYEISEKQSEYFLKFFGSYREDIGNDVKQDSDGGYVLVGTSETADSARQMYLVKTDKYGNEVDWSPKYFGGGLDDYGYCLQITDDGYILLGTATVSAGNKDILLVKTDKQGNTLQGFPKTIGDTTNEEGYDIEPTPDGFIITGYTDAQVTGTGKKNIWLVLIDQLGNTIWSRVWGGVEDDVGYCIKRVDDGYIILGMSRSYSGGQTDAQVLLFKTNSVGHPIDFYTFGQSGSDEFGESFQLDETGGGILAGTSYSADGSSTEIYLAKLNSDMSVEEIPLSKGSLDGTGNYTAKGVQISAEGHYIIIGSIEQLNEEDIYFLGIDQSGNKLFSKIYGRTGSQYGSKFEKTSDGGYILVGSNGYEGNTMIALIKTGPEGELE